MTSVLRQAFSNVKNLFFPARENDDSRRRGIPGSSFPKLRPYVTGIKRQHDNFEAELTEDDDDYNPPVASAKRFKTDDDISIVYYSKQPTNQFEKHRKGNMESSQPSENAADVLAFRTNSKNQCEMPTDGSVTFPKSLQPRNFKGGNEPKQSGDFRFEPSESKTSRFMSSCFPAIRKEDALKKNRHEKKISKTKQSSWFNHFGRRGELNNTVRIEEKMRYKQLLEKLSNPSYTVSRENGLLDQVNISRLGGTRSVSSASVSPLGSMTHLKFSRAEKPIIESIHEKWGTNYPTTSLEKRSRLLPTDFNFIKHSSPTASTVLPVSGIRLFSVPQHSSSFSKKNSAPPSPVVVDLEQEDLENVAPATSRKSKEFPGTSTPTFSSTPAAHRQLVTTRFGDLDEAEAAGNLFFHDSSFAEERNSTIKNESKDISREDDHKDQEILILSESIVKKGRERRVNSLALEQTSSPYRQKSWLSDLSSDWKENEEERKRLIDQETKTLNILRTESKIDETLHDALRKKLMLTEIIELEEKPLSLPEITEEMKIVIRHATKELKPPKDFEVLATVFNVDITRGDIKTLAPSKWLNDNVINVYMELIADRSKSGKYPKCHIFTTFFYPKYLKEGYSNVLKRWTRKVDIFSHDLLLFPIHLGMHWCLAVVDVRKKIIKYYDSLGGQNNKCLRSLLDYLSHEMKERKSQVLETNDWTLLNVPGIPQQQNGSDCGMFTCKFAECLSRDAKLDFVKQENINYYRERMIYELLKKDLMFP